MLCTVHAQRTRHSPWIYCDCEWPGHCWPWPHSQNAFLGLPSAASVSSPPRSSSHTQLNGLWNKKKRVIQRLLFRLCIIYDRVKCVKNYFLLLCDAFVSSVYMYVRVQFRLGADTCECSHIILDFNAMHNAWPECVRQRKSATARFREQLG